MKKILATSLITLTLLCGGCKKLLDTKPQDFLTPDQFFTKPEDATAALGAAWQMLTKQQMYGGYYQFRYETSDDCYTNLSTAFPANLGSPASDVQFSQRWNFMYQTIQYLNILLVNLPRVPMDETQRGVIRGEGLFLRGFLYYELVKEWGPIPVRLTPTTDATDVNLAATPIKDVYAQVLKDLTEAEALVPAATVTNYGGAGYAAKTTVQAILARVCLSMTGYPLNDVSKYQDVKTWTQKIVDSKLHSLNPDFTQVFKNYASGVIDKKESLWEIDFNYVSGNSAPSGSIGYLDGIRNNNVPFGASVGQYSVTRKLILAYGPFNTAGLKDLRRDFTCAPFQWHGGQTTPNSDADIEANKVYWPSTSLYFRYFAKFRLYYAPLPNATTGQSPINWPVVRYSDVLLMLAEAENYLNGPTALAYSCVNQVRERGWGKTLPGATNITEADEPAGLSKDAFQQEIQMERYRELAGEALRKQDLIRWGIFVSSVKGLLSDILDTTAPAEANRSATSSGQPYYAVLNLNKVTDRDLLWPIPTSELQYNKLLKQNPGW
jgi:hypothetical protein